MVKPEDKPMKKQWLEVDGRMTPIILPQIWSHEKQDWVVTSEQNPLPTQVTGSNVEFGKAENVLERKIRTKSTGFRVTKPKWAKGCLIELIIHGITGSFGINEGVEMSSFSRFKGGTGTGMRLRSAYVSETGTIQQLWFTGANLDDAESSNIDFKLANHPIAEEVAIGFNISGS